MMRRFLVTWAVLWSFLGCVYSQSGEPVGMILNVVGQSRIERDGEAQGAELAAMLYAGDQIIVDSGETTLMHCPSEQSLRLVQGTSLRVGTNDVVATGPDPIENPIGCALPRVAIGSESLERVGALQLRGLYPLVPLYTGGRIQEPHPVFRWGEVEGADGYEVALLEDGELLWIGQTTANELAYPASQPPLNESDYTWRLTARSDGAFVSEEFAEITIVERVETPDPAPVETIGDRLRSFFNFGEGEETPPAESGSAEADVLVEAAALENEGYYVDAAEQYRRLRDLEPASAERLTRHIAWLYSEAGLDAAAAEELATLE